MNAVNNGLSLEHATEKKACEIPCHSHVNKKFGV